MVRGKPSSKNPFLHSAEPKFLNNIAFSLQPQNLGKCSHRYLVDELANGVVRDKLPLLESLLYTVAELRT